MSSLPALHQVIGRKAEEVAEMAVEHYSLPYTGPEYLALHQVLHQLKIMN